MVYVPELPQELSFQRDHIPVVGGFPCRRFHAPKKDHGLTTLQHYWEQQTEGWTHLSETLGHLGPADAKGPCAALWLYPSAEEPLRQLAMGDKTSCPSAKTKGSTDY